MPAGERNNVTHFDIAQLDAAFHLKSIGRQWFLRAPFGVPAWGRQQKSLIGAYLMGGRKSFDAVQCTQALETQLREMFGVRFCIATGSGREAIKLALLGLDVQPGERVVLPSFSCFSVLQPLLQLGIEPVLADIGDDLQIDPDSVRRVMQPGDRALIVPHLFGGLADMPQLTSIARENGAAVIDDAAQALGLRGPKGWAGTGGAAGIFSFGLFKPLNAMGGGALLTDDENLYSRALRHVQGAKRPCPSRGEVIKTYIKTVWRRATFPLFLHHRRRQQKAHTSPQQKGRRQPLNQTVTLISPLHARLAASQLAHVADQRQQASAAAREFTEKLVELGFIQADQDACGDGLPRYVVRPCLKGPARFKDLFAALLKEGIEVQPTYRPLSRYLQAKGLRVQGEFQHSEKLSERLLCLPYSHKNEFEPVLKRLESSASLQTFFDDRKCSP